MSEQIFLPTCLRGAGTGVRCGLLAAVLMLSACDGGLTGSNCTDELRVAIQPSGAQQVAVGAAFTATIALSTCGGSKTVSDTFTWSARDTLVVRVEPATGRVTGRSPGATSVDVRGTRYGALGTVPVAVW
jgi:hypothetical protein